MNNNGEVPERGKWAAGYADLSNNKEGLMEDGDYDVGAHDDGHYYDDDESADSQQQYSSGDSSGDNDDDDDSPTTAVDAGALLAKMELNALAKRNATLTDEVDELRAEIKSLQTAARTQHTLPTPPTSSATSSSCAECAQSHVSAAMWESVCWTYFRLQRQEVQEWSHILSHHHHTAMELERKGHIDTLMRRVVVVNDDPVARCIHRWGGEKM